MPSSGARALGAQLEQRVCGSLSQDSIEAMVWSVCSVNSVSTVGNISSVRFGATLTCLGSCDRVEVMAAVKRFWSGGRRRFVARTLSTVGLVLVGGLVTGEVLEKLSTALKWLVGLGAFGVLSSAVVMWSDEDTSKEDG